MKTEAELRNNPTIKKQLANADAEEHLKLTGRIKAMANISKLYKWVYDKLDDPLYINDKEQLNMIETILDNRDRHYQRALHIMCQDPDRKRKIRGYKEHGE